MFKKNLMEFFVGLNFYLYYFYSGCTLSPWSYVLPECSVITWPCHMTLVPTLFISQPYCMSWSFGLNIWMLGKLFSFWSSYNTIIPTANYIPLSNIILSKSPWSFQTWSLNSLASSSTNVFFVVAIKCTILLNQSYTTKIVLYLHARGNFMMKSTKI